MWGSTATLLIAAITSLSALISIPWLTKVYAQQRVIWALKLTLERYRSIANSYTENGTPEELQRMIQNLEEVMEELKILEKCD